MQVSYSSRDSREADETMYRPILEEVKVKRELVENLRHPRAIAQVLFFVPPCCAFQSSPMLSPFLSSYKVSSTGLLVQ